MSRLSGLWNLAAANLVPINVSLFVILLGLTVKSVAAKLQTKKLPQHGPKVVGPTNAVPANQILLCQSAEFSKKEVIRVADGVWVAIGFGLANSIMIEGTDGVIIGMTQASFFRC
jgi:hypothetical protein